MIRPVGADMYFRKGDIIVLKITQAVGWIKEGAMPIDSLWRVVNTELAHGCHYVAVESYENPVATFVGLYQDRFELVERPSETALASGPLEDSSGAVAGYPDNNPKSVVGATKIPFHLLSPPALAEMAKVMADGAKKYGAFNWRDTSVASTVYISGMMRHLMAYSDGEDNAEDSGYRHLAHIMAGCAILIDAEMAGTLIDDRKKLGVLPSILDEYSEKMK